MRKAVLFFVAALAIFLSVAWANYRWHQGFTAGVDTSQCLQHGFLDGWDAAMKTKSCQNVKGKTPPFMPGWLRPQGPPADIEAVEVVTP